MLSVSRALSQLGDGRSHEHACRGPRIRAIARQGGFLAADAGFPRSVTGVAEGLPRRLGGRGARALTGATEGTWRSPNAAVRISQAVGTPSCGVPPPAGTTSRSVALCSAVSAGALHDVSLSSAGYGGRQHVHAEIAGAGFAGLTAIAFHRRG